MMMKAKVYFLPLSGRKSLLFGIGKLLNKLSIDTIVKRDELCAIKVHFGEKGNTSFVRPIFIAPIVEKISKIGGKPFLTDTNTLYVGTRTDAATHIKTAITNGFSYEVVGAPVIIADGLRGNSGVDVKLDGEVVKIAKIANGIYYSDSMVVVTHFKGHELTGFGGALKNLGMGCATREGKLFQHSTVSPKVNEDKCTGCKTCVKWCSHGAIEVDKVARIDESKCVGCGECILTCPNRAIEIRWNEDLIIFQKKMVEYAKASILNKREKVCFLNFILSVSPACDCYGFNDAPIVPDIGVLGSRDPVALDMACFDLVKKSPLNPGSFIFKGEYKVGEDKFKLIYPQIDSMVQIRHAEKIGLGTSHYELITLRI